MPRPLSPQSIALMHALFAAASPMAIAAAAAVHQPATATEPAFVDLFNGRDLSGWVNVNGNSATWIARDGMIVCNGHPTGLLRSARMYENFVLELDWQHMTPDGNSGVFVWSDALPVRGQPFNRAIEVQVMLGGESDWYTSEGDIFPIHGAKMTPENPRPKGGSRAFPTSKRTRPSPEWNHYRIECRGGDITLAVNGEVVTRGHNCSPRKGYICLESEGSEVHFRNIRLGELPPSAPAPSPEQVASADEGFVPLFTGDFTGWKLGEAHKGHWSVDDWTMVFDGEGEDLWTERS